MDFCRERFPIVHSLLQYSARREVTTPREVQLFRCSAALTCLEQGSSGSKLFPCAGIIGLGVAAQQRFVWSRKLELEPNASCGPGCLVGTRSAPTSGRQATLKRGGPDPLSRTTRNWSWFRMATLEPSLLCGPQLQMHERCQNPSRSAECNFPLIDFGDKATR